MKKLYIGKLSYSSTEAELRALFEEFGPVLSARIIKDSFSGQSRGFGFVELEDDEKAAEAIKALNGKSFGGMEIVVNEAREDGGRRGGGGGPRGGGGGNRGGGPRSNYGGGGGGGGRGGREGGGYGGGNRGGGKGGWR